MSLFRRPSAATLTFFTFLDLACGDIEVCWPTPEVCQPPHDSSDTVEEDGSSGDGSSGEPPEPPADLPAGESTSDPEDPTEAAAGRPAAPRGDFE
jgi:hypothetical protein